MVRSLFMLIAAGAGLLASQPARGQQTGDARPPETSRRDATAVAPDFKVVFWFGRDGLRHQVYDVRKGQYTQAVDDWLSRANRVQFDPSGYALPGPMATVRSVYLANEQGKTESEKLHSAIGREEGRILGVGRETTLPRPPLRFSADTANLAQDRPRRLRPSFVRPPGQFVSPWGGMPAYPFPVPYPYARPHP